MLWRIWLWCDGRQGTEGLQGWEGLDGLANQAGYGLADRGYRV
jgi:hypothetical protein